MTRFYGNGDLAIIPIKKLPDNLKTKVDGILEYGEVTGHAHQIQNNDTATVLIDSDNHKYIDAKQDTIIIHPDHPNIPIPRGFYMVARQREYNHYEEASRYVQD